MTKVEPSITFLVQDNISNITQPKYYADFTEKKDLCGLTSKQGDVSVLGVVGAARHPADLLSQRLQGVHLGSQMRWKVNTGSGQCGVVKANKGFEIQL